MRVPENKATVILTKPLVLVVVGGVLAALILWDVLLAGDDIGGNTWSELLRQAGKFTPAVPWLLGLVMGHWFHPGEDARPRIDPPGNALVLLGLTLVWVAVGSFVAVSTWLPVPLGGLAGWLLWPTAAAEPPAIDAAREDR